MITVGSLSFLSASVCYSDAEYVPDKEHYYHVPDFHNRVTIAGETIDLNRYDMRERYDRELTSFSYTHNLTFSIIKRANRYFPIVIPILKEEKIPEDFIYLMAIESSLNTRALSGVKAAGLWQLMPETAKQFGLEVNNYVDERYHIEKSTRAACKYFRQAYAKYNNWMTVAASYNAGQGRISRELELQQAGDVFDLWLVDETTRYPFRMMALKEIMKSPSKYGFVLKRDQLYKPIRLTNVKVNEPIDDLASFANSYGINYRILKDFNPWLRDRSLPNKTGKEYVLQIPNKDDLYYNEKHFKVYNKHWVVD
jgi:Soluble lytic murein transglycosylase and related regulatory proteins (some contain LysM/invasin domains)